MENSVFSVPLWLISALSIREVILNTFLSGALPTLSTRVRQIGANVSSSTGKLDLAGFPPV